MAAVSSAFPFLVVMTSVLKTPLREKEQRRQRSKATELSLSHHAIYENRRVRSRLDSRNRLATDVCTLPELGFSYQLISIFQL